MSDMRDFLGRGVEGFDPSAVEGFERTHDRTRKRQRRRQFLAGAVTVAMFGGTLAGAVWLGGQRGRPVAGPTPTASPAPTASPGSNLGEATCQGPFRGDRVCVYPTSHVVLVGSGESGGVPWALHAWTGTYIGPPPDASSDPAPQPDVEVAVLCTAWTFGEPRQPRCQGRGEHASWSIALVEMPGVQKGGSLEAQELAADGLGGGFLIDPADGLTAIWAWTPSETSRVVLTTDAGDTHDAELFGPFSDLGINAKWFVAFVPSTAGPLTARADDDAGRNLWAYEGPIPTRFPKPQPMVPRSPVATVAQGTYEGGEWKLLVHRAIEAHGGTEHLCFQLELSAEDDDLGSVCTELSQSLPGGAMGLDTDGDGPLPMILYGYTSTDTARVEIAEAGVVTEASLHQAPPELGVDMQFLVGFSDGEADITVRAFDADGEQLWSEAKPYHPD